MTVNMRKQMMDTLPREELMKVVAVADYCEREFGQCDCWSDMLREFECGLMGCEYDEDDLEAEFAWFQHAWLSEKFIDTELEFEPLMELERNVQLWIFGEDDDCEDEPDETRWFTRDDIGRWLIGDYAIPGRVGETVDEFRVAYEVAEEYGRDEDEILEECFLRAGEAYLLTTIKTDGTWLGFANADEGIEYAKTLWESMGEDEQNSYDEFLVHDGDFNPLWHALDEDWTVDDCEYTVEDDTEAAVERYAIRWYGRLVCKDYDCTVTVECDCESAEVIAKAVAEKYGLEWEVR